MIIIGYPGIGKSTIGGKLNCIDLESSSFFNSNGVRPAEWYEYYCNIANYLSKQGYNVLISSHASVTKKLIKSSDEDIIIIAPSPLLKDEWVEKLRKRAKNTKSDKDFRAYINSKDNYDSNISNIINNDKVKKYIIKNMDYKLEDIIKEIVEK